jgi:hypothetical protein
VADGTALTVLELPRATNRRPRDGVLDQDPDPLRMRRLRDLANALYADLNEAGAIS